MSVQIVLQHPPSFTKVEVLHLHLLVFILNLLSLDALYLITITKSRWNPSLGSDSFRPVFARSIDHKYTRLSRHSTWMLLLTVTARYPILTVVSVFNTQVPRMYPFYDRSLSCRNDHSNFLCDLAELSFLCSSLAIQTFQFSFSLPSASNQLSVIVFATDFK